MNTQFALGDKVALVTGATSGLGRRQAQALAWAGARVVLLGRRSERLQQACAEIKDQGGQAAWLVADLNQREQLPNIATQAGQYFGSIDIVINAAGANLRQPAAEVTLASWDLTLNLNLAVPFFWLANWFRLWCKKLGPDYQYGLITIQPGVCQ